MPTRSMAVSMSSGPNGSGWNDTGWRPAPNGSAPEVRSGPDRIAWALGAVVVVLLVALAGIVGYLFASAERSTAAPESSIGTPASAVGAIPDSATDSSAASAGAAGAAESAECDPDVIASQTGIARRNVNVDRCMGDWALAHVYVPPGEPAGDTMYIVHRVGGSWERHTSIPSSICKEDAIKDGMPAEIAGSLDGCARGADSGGGDLGLSTPMTRPSCDGRGIVVLYSAVTPGAYAQEISSALAQYPGASYLRTDMSCPSLRQRDENGNVIYAVYLPSGYTTAEICADVRAAGPPAYGRWLDLTSDPSQLITC